MEHVWVVFKGVDYEGEEALAAFLTAPEGYNEEQSKPPWWSRPYLQDATAEQLAERATQDALFQKQHTLAKGLAGRFTDTTDDHPYYVIRRIPIASPGD